MDSEKRKSRGKDLTGQRFGRLTVQREAEPARTPKGVAVRRWECRCDCGNTVIVNQNALTAKKNGTRSCGCLQAEAMRNKATDMMGQRFGRLTVTGYCDLEKPESNGNKRGIVCLCDCGREITTTRKALLEGLQSCGCLRNEIARKHAQEGSMGHKNGTNVRAIREGRPPNANNKSDILGVYYNEREGRWIAKIGIKGKTIALGRFATKEEAAAARHAAEEEYFGPLREEHKDE